LEYGGKGGEGQGEWRDRRVGMKVTCLPSLLLLLLLFFQTSGRISKCTVYVNNLQRDITEQELQELFRQVS
jgi:hypothetical protein